MGNMSGSKQGRSASSPANSSMECVEVPADDDPSSSLRSAFSYEDDKDDEQRDGHGQETDVSSFSSDAGDTASIAEVPPAFADRQPQLLLQRLEDMNGDDGNALMIWRCTNGGCFKRFRFYHEYERHVKREHEHEDERGDQDSKAKKFNSLISGLQRLSKNQGKQRVSCTDCGACMRRDSLKRHILTVHGNKSTGISMGHGDNSVSNTVKASQKKGISASATVDDQPLPSTSGDSQGRRILKCSTCNRLFMSKERLMMHEQLHGSSVLLLLQQSKRSVIRKKQASKAKTGSKSPAKSLTSISKSRLFDCKTCDKKYTQRSSLTTHERFAHTNNTTHDKRDADVNPFRSSMSPVATGPSSPIVNGARPGSSSSRRAADHGEDVECLNRSIMIPIPESWSRDSLQSQGDRCKLCHAQLPLVKGVVDLRGHYVKTHAIAADVLPVLFLMLHQKPLAS